MSLNPNFTASQSLANSNIITLTDSSTGQDTSITSRRVLIQKADGAYLVQQDTTTNYEVWNIGVSSIDLNLIKRATSPNVTIQWMNGAAVVYTKTIAVDFNADELLFRLSKAKVLASDPTIVNDASFYTSFLKFSAHLIGAKDAIELDSDIANAQSLHDRNYDLIINESKYF